MDSIFYFFICIVIAVAGEIAIADAISNAGLTGFQSVLFLAALPGALILYVLGQSANQ